MCMKSSLSTKHFWQPVINVLSPFSWRAVVSHLFHPFPTVVATQEVQLCYSEYRRNQITKSILPAPLYPICYLSPMLFSVLFHLCMRFSLLFVLFSYSVLLVFVVEVTVISSFCFQGLDSFSVSAITTSIFIQSRVCLYVYTYVYILTLLVYAEIPGTLNYVSYVEQATPIRRSLSMD